MSHHLPHSVLIPQVQRALDEDLGRNGDITTRAVIDKNTTYQARVVSRKPGVLCGLQPARLAFELIDPTLDFTTQLSDGAALKKGTLIAEISGNARSILMGERVALNYLGHLSGIASATRLMADKLTGTKARIACTRKTTPGMRNLEKFAVSCGGGLNHRFALDDAILIKDNHIAAAGGIKQVLDKANNNKSHMIKIMIEVDNLDQLDEVLAHGGADIVMLDNFSLNDLKLGVKQVNGQIGVEASGNVNPDTVADIAQTGVDTISSGWITHSAANLDIGLDF